MELTQQEIALLSVLAMTQVYDPNDIKTKGEIMRSLKGLAREIGEGIVGNRRGLSKEVVDVSLMFLEWAREQKAAR
jgi:hypothetical protein